MNRYITVTDKIKTITTVILISLKGTISGEELIVIGKQRRKLVVVHAGL